MNPTPKLEESGMVGDMETVVETPRTLTALERCDGCGAQAYLAVDLNQTELLFCAHHGAKGIDKLKALGATILVDEREKLLTPVVVTD